ncbi:MAG: hypothetical protein ACI83O_000264 [Patescibacteria group bacterium]|jgi:hypothetical protein
MKRSTFTDSQLEDLLKNDSGIKEKFSGASTDYQKHMVGTLRSSLEDSYNIYLEDYMQQGISGYASSGLRKLGAGANAWGTGTFYTLGPIAAAAYKTTGLLANSAADLIDSVHYMKSAKTNSIGEKVKDLSLIGAEALTSRVAAYTPFGVGEAIDYKRGRSKFDNKVTNRAINYAKTNFFDNLYKEEEGLKFIKTDNFKNPQYSQSSQLAA